MNGRSQFRPEHEGQHTPFRSQLESLKVIHSVWKDGTEVSTISLEYFKPFEKINTSQLVKDFQVALPHFKVRSMTLRSLDDAFSHYIKTPNEDNLQKLKSALEKWKKSKGSGEEWRLDARNAAGVITALNNMLYNNWQKGLLKKRQVLMATLAKQGAQNVLAELVRDRKVDFKQGLGGKIAHALKGKAEKEIKAAYFVARHKINDIREKQTWKDGKTSGGSPASGFVMGSHRSQWKDGISGAQRGLNPQPRLGIGGHRTESARAKNFLVETVTDIDTISSIARIGTGTKSLVKGIRKLVKNPEIIIKETVSHADDSHADKAKKLILGVIKSGNLDQVASTMFSEISSRMAALGLPFNDQYAAVVAALHTGIIDILAQLLNDFVPEVVSEVVDFVFESIPDFIEELAGAIAPYVGTAVSGFKMTQKIVEVSKQGYDHKKAKDHTRYLGSGTASEAGKALIALLDQELKLNAGLASISAAQFGAKLAGQIADAVSFGAPTVSVIITPTAGLIGTIASLSAQIFRLAVDCQRKYEGNKLIAARNFKPAEMFEKCPILGCYFLTCASDMVLTEMVPEEMMRPEWSCVHNVIGKRDIIPLVERAANVMATSKLCLAGGDKLRGDDMAKYAGNHGITNIGEIKGKLGDRAIKKLSS